MKGKTRALYWRVVRRRRAPAAFHLPFIAMCPSPLAAPASEVSDGSSTSTIVQL